LRRIGAYYNDNDRFIAAWLRILMARRIIADGDVDERSISEVDAKELAGYAQCHFFAGVGGWSIALRRAGWPDNLSVWTGSCPCQSFSNSGKREGFSDPRHLWPTWLRLIEEHRPDTLLGEQVASKDGLAWLDVVSADLENAGYAIGAQDTSAASVGAPQKRQRFYFVADATGGNTIAERLQRSRQHGQLAQDSEAGVVAHTQRRRREQRDTGQRRIQFPDAHGIVEHTEFTRLERHAGNGAGERGSIETGSASTTGASDNFWKDVRWIWCSDGKLRPVPPESAFFPLAARSARRVGVLRGIGNSIVAPQAQAFIECVMEEFGLEEKKK
jgi:DNA (cytosine-5)-methyltransferase 1